MFISDSQSKIRLQRNKFLFTSTNVLSKKVPYIAHYTLYCAILMLVLLKIAVIYRVIIDAFFKKEKKDINK